MSSLDAGKSECCRSRFPGNVEGFFRIDAMCDVKIISVLNRRILKSANFPFKYKPLSGGLREGQMQQWTRILKEVSVQWNSIWQMNR